MRRTTIAFFLIGFSGCGGALPGSYTPHIVDASAVPILQKFNEEAQKWNGPSSLTTDISIQIQSLNVQGEVGICHEGGDIVIDSAIWNRSSASWKVYILAHELGHCVLHRDHRESPNSFMRRALPAFLNDRDLETYWHELFKPQDFPS